MRRVLICVLLLLLGLGGNLFAGARSLSDPSKVSSHRSRSSSRSSSKSSSYSSSSDDDDGIVGSICTGIFDAIFAKGCIGCFFGGRSSYSTYTSSNSVVNATNNDAKAESSNEVAVAASADQPFRFSGDVFSDSGFIPKGHSVLEYAYMDWDVSSASGEGVGPGAEFVGSYNIDPVHTVRVGGFTSVKSWIFGLNYMADPSSPDAAEWIGATAMRYDPSDRTWLSLNVEKGRIEGVASTKDYQGTIHEAPLDSVWTRVSLELRGTAGVHGLLAYEDLKMPAVFGLYDATGPVMAIFDDTARWRTLSLGIGYDRSIKRIMERDYGWAFDWACEGNAGLGTLSHDDEGVEGIALTAGYDLNKAYLLYLLSLQGHVGLSYTGNFRSRPVQAFVGYRMRYVRRSAGLDEDSVDTYYSDDTLYEDIELEVVSHGPFVRFSTHW